MKEIKGSIFTEEDILKRSNFDALKKCIVEMTTTYVGGMRAGLKVSLWFVLKKVVKIMKGQFIMKNIMKEEKRLIFQPSLQFPVAEYCRIRFKI